VAQLGTFLTDAAIPAMVSIPLRATNTTALAVLGPVVSSNSSGSAHGALRAVLGPVVTRVAGLGTVRAPAPMPGVCANSLFPASGAGFAVLRPVVTGVAGLGTLRAPAPIPFMESEDALEVHSC
jgi:hypothetical protein